jgi:hypothetical protein
MLHLTKYRCKFHLLFKIRDETFAELQFSQLNDFLSSAPHKQVMALVRQATATTVGMP